MMKGIIKSFLIVFACVLIASPTFAGKPQNVISMSNGYPSGAHFNLIIHGKKTGNSDVVAEEVTTFNCPSGEGGEFGLCRRLWPVNHTIHFQQESILNRANSA